MLRRLMMPMALAALSALSGVAQAHPMLRSANPVANALTRAPSQVRLTFNEALIARFSGIEIVDGRGRVVVRGNALMNSPDRRQLVVPLRVRLSPGSYRLNWHAVSADTHRVKGTYIFRVGR